jgi:hypothetical protein
MFNSNTYNIFLIMFKYINSHIKKYKFNISNYFSFNSMENKLRLLTKDETVNFLKENNIAFEVEDHEKADTTQQGLDLIKTDKVKDWTFCKNLFLKNKSGGYILLTAHHVRDTL